MLKEGLKTSYQVEFLRQRGELVPVWYEEGDAEGLLAVAADADVLHHGAGLQDGLDLAQGNVLAELKLHLRMINLQRIIE